MVFIIFIGLFALDVFGAGYGFWQTAIALFVHLIPSFVLIVILVIAWRWPGLGGLLYIFFGLAYIAVIWFRINSAIFLIIAAPLFIIGFLFVLDRFRDVKIEMLELLDEQGRPTGKLASRRTIHEKALWHRAAHVWLVDSRGQILLQRRSANKESWPGLWDISVAGHVQAVESAEQAARRELFEELGIKADNLKKIGTTKVSKSIPKKNYFENEVFDSFLVKFNSDISAMKLEDREVAEVKLISFDDFEKQIKDPEQRKQFVPHWEYYLEMIGEIKRAREENYK